ncbi:MAG: glucosyl-3-phosphoglycerate synthase [Actinomycetota bacterium]
MSSSIRTFHLDRAGTATGPAALAAKAGRTVSVCIPCRDEAATIGPLVTTIRDELVEAAGFVDELIVLDDRSTDDTATVAAHAGARVVSIDDVHASYGAGRGKGNALWASLLVSSGDVVVWCDGDVTSLEPEWIQKLALPILTDETVALVKALYDRPTSDGGGGRTTELVARPMLSRWFPELAEVAQPLAGEYAVRRSVVERLTFEQGWGVEVGLLIDVARTCGVDAVGQVDLGSRLHRHRSLQSLSVQAAEVMATILDRAGHSDDRSGAPDLVRADGSSVPLNVERRRPIASLRAAS